MDWFYAIALSVLHIFWSLCSFVISLWRVFRSSSPAPLNSPRRQLPAHVSVAFACTRQLCDDDIEGMVESIRNAANWCRVAGISHLSFFSNDDSLLRCKERVQAALAFENESIAPDLTDASDSELEYPLTPPPSDSSRSRSISPDHLLASQPIYRVTLKLNPAKSPRSFSSRKGALKRRKRSEGSTSRQSVMGDLSSMFLLSRTSSKPCLGDITRRIVNALGVTNQKDLRVSLTQVNEIMDEIVQAPAPDLLIVHPLNDLHSLELHGYPPWLLRLTEIYYARAPNCLTFSKTRSLLELTFRHALDDYASAEMRVGK